MRAVWLPRASKVSPSAPTVSFMAPIKPVTAAVVAGSRSLLLPPDGPTVAAAVEDVPVAFAAAAADVVSSLARAFAFASLAAADV